MSEGDLSPRTPAVPEVTGVELDTRQARPRLLLRSPRYVFPPPEDASPEGYAAVGADFSPETVVAAYRRGLFPWPHPFEEYLWSSPDPRAIIPIGGLHVARRLARTIRQGRFRVTLDTSFEQVIAGCAIRAEGTWITDDLRSGYSELHLLGYAHSIEVWDVDGTLAGGLYGVGVGAMFGAESMFHVASNASKVALVALMAHASTIGLQLVDIQMLTPHTASMGALEIPRVEYLLRLREALRWEVDWSGASPPVPAD